MKVKLKTNLMITINKKEVNIIEFRGREYQVQIINDNNIVVSSNQLIEGYNVDMYVTKHKKYKEFNIAKRCYLNVGKFYAYIVIDNDFEKIIDLYFKLKESEK